MTLRKGQSWVMLAALMGVILSGCWGRDRESGLKAMAERLEGNFWDRRLETPSLDFR